MTIFLVNKVSVKLCCCKKISPRLEPINKDLHHMFIYLTYVTPEGDKNNEPIDISYFTRMTTTPETPRIARIECSITNECMRMYNQYVANFATIKFYPENEIGKLWTQVYIVRGI